MYRGGQEQVHECKEIDDNKEVCAKVCLSVASREESVTNEGQQSEHLQDCT